MDWFLTCQDPMRMSTCMMLQDSCLNLCHWCKNPQGPHASGEWVVVQPTPLCSAPPYPCPTPRTPWHTSSPFVERWSLVSGVTSTSFPLVESCSVQAESPLSISACLETICAIYTVQRVLVAVFYLLVIVLVRAVVIGLKWIKSHNSRERQGSGMMLIWQMDKMSQQEV